MFQGQLIGIFLTGRKGQTLQPVDKVEAVAGRGLVGDRYFLKEGTYSEKDGPDREVTLIEAEALEGLAHEYEITLAANCSRAACPSIISSARRSPSAVSCCAASACASRAATSRSSPARESRKA